MEATAFSKNQKSLISLKLKLKSILLFYKNLLKLKVTYPGGHLRTKIIKLI